MPVVAMNYLAVLVGAVVSVVIGALWYMPALFGNGWMSAIGKTKEQVEKDFSPLKIVWALIFGFVISYGLARLLVWSGKNTPVGGLEVGLLACIGFVLTTTGVHHVFESRPAKLTIIYTLHHLVEFLAIGLILGAWM
jgi:hypothetical protein